MKRKLFIAIVALLTLSACMRDEDWKLLRHPIHMQGQVDPRYGVPVAYGKMTFHDILGMLSSTYTGNIYDTTDVITIYFDTNFADTIKNIIPGSFDGEKGSRKTDPQLFKLMDTTLDYKVNITLFDGLANNEMFDDHNITIGDLWLNLNLILQALVPQQVAQYVDNENYVSSHVDHFEIYYTNHDGAEIKFSETIPDETLKHLIEGDTITKSINLKEIVNEMPKSVRIVFHYDFWISDEFLFGMTLDEAQEIRNYIKQLQMRYDANLHVEFPFDIKINRLPYNFTINLSNDSLSSLDIQQTLDSIARGLSVNLKDAKLRLAFDNHIPANINVAAFLLDANEAIIGDTLIRDTRIVSAPVGIDPVSGKTVSNGSTNTILEVPIDAKRLEDLKNTRKIGFNLALVTGAGTATVAIRRDDFLYIKAFVMVHPNATADIPITNQALLK